MFISARKPSKPGVSRKVTAKKATGLADKAKAAFKSAPAKGGFAKAGYAKGLVRK